MIRRTEKHETIKATDLLESWLNKNLILRGKDVFILLGKGDPTSEK